MTIVVCVYTDRRWEQITASVASVARQCRPKDQIIVVSDYNDELLDRVRRTFPDLMVIPNVDVRGLSGARNTGVRAAVGEVVAFLDDDARAAPGWLDAIIAGYEDAAVLGVGGKVTPDWIDGRPHWLPEEFDWVVGCSYRGMPERRASIRNFIGANMSFRRSVFEKVGYFDTGIGRTATAPLGCEETEFAIRVRQEVPSAVLSYDPGAEVHHMVPAERGRLSYFLRRCFAEGLSKAFVAGLVGASDATASERNYVTRTLTSGFVRSLVGRGGGFMRAPAIFVGLGVTSLGYGLGRVGLGARALHLVEQRGRVTQTTG